MNGQACVRAGRGGCPRVSGGANEAPCVWRRLHPLMGMGDAARWARRFACVMGSGVWIARVFRGGRWGRAKRGAGWRLAQGTVPGSHAALLGAWMARRFAARLDGLRAGAFQSAQRSGLKSLKKSSNRLKPAWMLRSALSNQEKFVDNLLFACLVGWPLGRIGLRDERASLRLGGCGPPMCERWGT